MISGSYFIFTVFTVGFHIDQDGAAAAAAITETEKSFIRCRRNLKSLFFHFQKRGCQSFPCLKGCFLSGTPLRLTSIQIREYDRENSSFCIMLDYCRIEIFHHKSPFQ